MVILIIKISTKLMITIKVMSMIKVGTILPNKANESQLSPTTSRNPIVFCLNTNREKTLSNEVNLLRDSVSVAYAPPAPPGGRAQQTELLLFLGSRRNAEYYRAQDFFFLFMAGVLWRCYLVLLAPLPLWLILSIQ